jgi:BLTP1 N-terminal region
MSLRKLRHGYRGTPLLSKVANGSRVVPSMWRTVRDLIPFFQESSESLAKPPTPPRSGSEGEEKPWAGLPRYSTNPEEDLSTADASDRDPLLQPTDVTEYAKVTTVLDAKELDLTFYYDEAGFVPAVEDQLPSEERHIGNGDVSPEWGMNIEVSFATIVYGPWTDRQRIILQEMFFPGSYEDAAVAVDLSPGDRRVYAYFKVFVEFKDAVTFKIPTKEKSKVIPTGIRVDF